MNRNTKQVIIMRKFPNIKMGKYCSQAAHASIAFLTKHGEMYHDWNSKFPIEGFFSNKTQDMTIHYTAIDHWLKNSFRKIICYVETEEELIGLHEKALASGIISHIVEDNGATEFHGVLTKTCVAIGPAWDDDINKITRDLPLF